MEKTIEYKNHTIEINRDIDCDDKVLDNSKILELASNLAHKYLKCNIELANEVSRSTGQRQLSIYKDENAEVLEYAEEAQIRFNRIYDDIYNQIVNI